MIGMKKFPMVAGTDGTRNRKIMMMPCMREHLVIGVGGHEIRLRRQQLKTDQAGQRSSDEEEERDRDQVQHRDPLVVTGQQPAQQTVFL